MISRLTSKHWGDIFASPGDVDVTLYVYGYLGTGPGAPFRHCVGPLYGEPVGCSSLLPAAGVVTVQHVATAEGFQLDCIHCLTALATSFATFLSSCNTPVIPV